MRTKYAGPVVVASMKLAGRTIKLVRPADPDQLLDDPLVADWNRHDDYMPYWAYLWPAAYLLAEAVAREPWRALLDRSHPAEALEIGCGLGLAGLVAVARGLRVQFTDYDPAPLISSHAVQPKMGLMICGFRYAISTGETCPTSNIRSSSAPT